MSQVGPKYTPKRSFEAAFSNEQFSRQIDSSIRSKPVDSQNFLKPIYNSQASQPTVHYQTGQLYSGSQNYSGSLNAQTTLPAQNLQSLQTFLYNPISSGSDFQSSACSNPQTYNNSALKESAFGGFNFGMNNHLMTNQNIQSGTINQRPSSITNTRDSMIF